MILHSDTETNAVTCRDAKEHVFASEIFQFLKSFFEIFHTASARYRITMQENKTFVAPVILLMAH